MKWLHISDIHYNPALDGGDTLHLRERFFSFVEKLNIKVDHVFFTGDFRFAKLQKDYQTAAEDAASFLRKVSKCVGVARADRIFMVPGNHDVERDGDVRAKVISSLVREYKPEQGDVGAGTLETLLKRFAPFGAFVQAVHEGQGKAYWEPSPQEPHGAKPGAKYNLLLLNTALICNRDGEDGLTASPGEPSAPSLIVGKKHATEAFHKLNNGKPTIVLGHHGVSCLMREEQIKLKHLFRDYDVCLYLCGHSHTLGDEAMEGFHQITVGCMKQEEGVRASFSIGELDEAGNALTVKAYAWYPEKSQWDMYPIGGNVDGSLTVMLPSSAGKTGAVKNAAAAPKPPSARGPVIDESSIRLYSDDELEEARNLIARERIYRASSGEISEVDIARTAYSFEERILAEIASGIVCESHKRIIHITPESDYYTIRTYLSAKYSSKYQPLNLRPFRFKYISEQQVASFKLLSLTINGEVHDINSIHIARERGWDTIPQPITSTPNFSHNVVFSLPIDARERNVEFELGYEYKNFSQSCFLTYAIGFLTQKYYDRYCIEGMQKEKYMIHGFAFPGFVRKGVYPVDRINDEVLSIEFSDWILPTTGVAVVVRKKHF